MKWVRDRGSAALRFICGLAGAMRRVLRALPSKLGFVRLTDALIAGCPQLGKQTLQQPSKRERQGYIEAFQ
jgi:hypothetical protein